MNLLQANKSSAQRLRSQALRKIASLSATSTKAYKKPDLTRLYHACPHTQSRHSTQSLSQSPITISELDVLFALCKAAPLLDDVDNADRLLRQLSPYLLEAHAQAISPSPFLRLIEPSPWEALSCNLTSALLAIGIRHPDLRDSVFVCITGYLRNCISTVNIASGSQPRSEGSGSDNDIEEKLELAAVSVSLLGFLEAASLYTNFYTISESYDLVELLRQILDENLMVSVEGVFSSIRTSERTARGLMDWKSYTKRYAASGRPLGATLLQRGYMRLLVSCSSLQVSSAKKLQKTDIFEILAAQENFTPHEQHHATTSLMELLSDVAMESMRLLEDGSDYLQLGSAWQQRLAFAVKAHTLQTFLNCMVVDEEVADADIILSWLEDTMADPIQMADDTLACVVLKSMAVIAKLSPAIASNLGRSLPRFVVQGGIKGQTVIVAARTLTLILRMLPQDAMITGLYSLGNVLSARTGTERAVGSSDLPNGTTNSSKATTQYTQHSTGSAISLDLSGEEETSAAYGNIVRTIVSIATTCQDDKTTALAQSMLIQKLGRVSLTVDLHIITETARLATVGDVVEFKSLLKLYARLGHDAIIRGNQILSDTVRINSR